MDGGLCRQWHVGDAQGADVRCFCKAKNDFLNLLEIGCLNSPQYPKNPKNLCLPNQLFLLHTSFSTSIFSERLTSMRRLDVDAAVEQALSGVNFVQLETSNK